MKANLHAPLSLHYPGRTVVHKAMRGLGVGVVLEVRFDRMFGEMVYVDWSSGEQTDHLASAVAGEGDSMADDTGPEGM